MMSRYLKRSQDRLPNVVGAPDKVLTLDPAKLAEENNGLGSRGRIQESQKQITAAAIKKMADHGQGFGYFGHSARNSQYDQMVADQANKLGWSMEEVGAFGDSKDGRHLGDELMDADPKDAKGLIAKYMGKTKLDDEAVSDWIEKVADLGLATGPKDESRFSINGGGMDFEKLVLWQAIENWGYGETPTPENMKQWVSHMRQHPGDYEKDWEQMVDDGGDKKTVQELKAELAKLMKKIHKESKDSYAKYADWDSVPFLFVVDMDERGEYKAHVEDMDGNEVFDFGSDDDGEVSMFEDGFMKNASDMSGLTKYLRQHKMVPDHAVIYDKQSAFDRAVQTAENQAQAAQEESVGTPKKIIESSDSVTTLDGSDYIVGSYKASYNYDTGAGSGRGSGWSFSQKFDSETEWHEFIEWSIMKAAFKKDPQKIAGDINKYPLRKKTYDRLVAKLGSVGGDDLIEGVGAHGSPLTEGVDLPVGYFQVTDDFAISFGAWGVSFKKGSILRYDRDFTMWRWDPVKGDWARKSPPIQDTPQLQISKYGYEYDQKKQLDKFMQSTKKISEKVANGLTASASAEEIIMVKDWDRFVKKSGLQPRDSVKIILQKKP